MSFTVSEEITIKKPLTQVLNYVFEPTNEPYWVTGVQESHMLSVRPIGQGTQVQRIQKTRSKTIEYVYEVTEFDPAGRMKMISMNRRFPLTVEYKLEESSGNHTRFRQSISIKTDGIYEWFDFLTLRDVRNTLLQDLRHLKSVLEK